MVSRNEKSAGKNSRMESPRYSIMESAWRPATSSRITSYNVCYTKLLRKAFEYLVPDEFDYIEIPDERVEAIFVNKLILRKLDQEKIVKILTDNVFPSYNFV